MSITVITVTYNSAATLQGYARGIARNQNFIHEVIIVDNGSTDKTWAALEELRAELAPDLKLVRSSNNGFAGGYEVASKFVSGSGPVLCLNPDVELAPGVLGDMLMAMMSNPGFGVLTTSLVDLDGIPDTASVRSLPQFGTSILYAAIGRFTPRRWRYNSRLVGAGPVEEAGRVRPIQATTGALMLVNPAFRSPNLPMFDTDYWMYGEDLQMCLDAARAGWAVGMVDTPPSQHLKGASSGRPRRFRSNVAFHRAMYTYYSKNLRKNGFEAFAVAGGVMVRGSLSILASSFSRGIRRFRVGTRAQASV